MNARAWLILAAAGLGATGVWWGYEWLAPSTVDDSATAPNTSPRVESLPQGVSADDYAAAAETLQGTTGVPPDRADVLSHLADRAASRHRDDVALACYAEIPTDHPEHGRRARLNEAQILIRQRRFREGEEKLKGFLRLEGQSPQLGETARRKSREWLRYLYSVQLRFRERQQLLREMYRRGELDTRWTLFYCFPRINRWNVSRGIHDIEAACEKHPQNVRLRAVLGRYRIAQGRLDEARRILETCHRQRPDDLRITAALLKCLHEQAAWERIEAIVKTLPPRSDTEPWLLTNMRGHIHNHAGEYQQAADCFRRLLDVMPANGEFRLGLARAYRGLNRPEQQQAQLRTAQVIARIITRFGWVMQQPDNADVLTEMAELCRQIRLRSQAVILARLAVKANPRQKQAQDMLLRLTTKQTESSDPRSQALLGNRNK